MFISKLQVSGEPKTAELRGRSSCALQRSNAFEIEGTVRANLRAALTSARRWRDRPVHPDTLCFWGQLIDHARREAAGADGDCLSELIAELESRLVQNSAWRR
jgi:hypothetical protein